MILLDSQAIDTLLDRMAEELATVLPAAASPPCAIIGIHTGGVWIARELHRRLQSRIALEAEVGALDISFYRDDFSRIGVSPRVRPSSLPFALDERPVLLVDDVLYTGRTIRAALDELFDFGRPSLVRLAVLINRCCHELPIAADVSGQQISPEHGERIKLSGPQPLELHLQDQPPGTTASQGHTPTS